ncbi:MAG: lectin-like protein [Pseudomonadota bacterium]
MKKTLCAMAVLFAGSVAQAVPVQWDVASGGNDHFYDIIATTLTWAEARDAAAAMTYNGLDGHLVTITSAGEQAFLDSLNPSGRDLWLGASDAANEGDWRWVTGPETGLKLDDTYTNWYGNEPNQWRGNPENYAVGWWATGWNDIPGTARFGYIVEYSVPAAVPLPATGALVLAALGVLGLHRRFR